MSLRFKEAKPFQLRNIISKYIEAPISCTNHYNDQYKLRMNRKGRVTDSRQECLNEKGT